MTEPAPIAFAVDDDLSVRRSLRRLLSTAGLRAQVFASAEEFLAAPLPDDAPACLILDVCLPGLGGLDLQLALAERHATLPIVFITGHGDIPQAVRAMRAGAVDFLPKPFSAGDLLAAVRRALASQMLVRQAETEVAALRRRMAALSTREQEVMALVVSGLLNKQIGHRLGVSEKTVKAHRGQVMAKMQADSLADLVRMAGRLGIEAPSPCPLPGPA
jgi:FixJ family two-component response regulator